MEQKILRRIPIMLAGGIGIIEYIIIRTGKFDPGLLEIELPKKCKGICQIPRNLLEGI